MESNPLYNNQKNNSNKNANEGGSRHQNSGSNPNAGGGNRKKKSKKKRSKKNNNTNNNRRGRGGYNKRYNNNNDASGSRGSNTRNKKKGNNNNKRRRGGYRGGGNNYNNDDYFFGNEQGGIKNSSREYQGSIQEQPDFSNKIHASVNEGISGDQTPKSFNSNYIKSSKKQNYKKKNNYDRQKYDDQESQYKPRSQVKDQNFRKDREGRGDGRDGSDYYAKKDNSNRKQRNKNTRNKGGKYKKGQRDDYQKGNNNFNGQKSQRFKNEYESKKTIPVTTNMPSSHNQSIAHSQKHFPPGPMSNFDNGFDSFPKMGPPSINPSMGGMRPNPIPHNPDIIPQNPNMGLQKMQEFTPRGSQIPLQKHFNGPQDFRHPKQRRDDGMNDSMFQDRNNYNDHQQRMDQRHGKMGKRWNGHKDKFNNNYNNNNYNSERKFYNNDLHPAISILNRSVRKNLWSVNKNFFLAKKVEDFDPYVTYEEAKELIVQEKAFRGTVQFEEKLPSLGIIQSEDFIKKVFANVKYTNRSIEGCEVIFMPISQNWQKYLTVNQTEETRDLEIQEQKEIESEKRVCLSSDYRYQLRHRFMTDEDLKLEKTKVKVKVIYIEKNPLDDRNIIVKVRKIMTGEYVAQFVYDQRYPQFSIETDSLTLNNYKNSQDTSCYYLAKYKEWDTNERFPQITLLEPLGKVGMVSTECDSLLKQFDIPAEQYHKKFTDDILKEFKVDAKGELEMTEAITEGRTDLTSKLIFTINSSFDDDREEALSIEDLGKGVYKVGVHISDVSYFVKQNSDLDNEAKRRANSYVLPHTVYSMLPDILCKNFCKLEPGKERLAFSIFFKLSSKGELVTETPELCKSIIKSKCCLPYKIVEEIIEGKIENSEDFPFKQFPVYDCEYDELKSAILTLHKVANARKVNRLKSGSIFFANQEKLRFRIDEDDGDMPISWEYEQVKEAKCMIQEYMLLANVVTAKILLQNYPNLSLLRKNPPPSSYNISKAQANLEKFGKYKIKLNTSKSIAKAIFEINSKNLNPIIREYLNYCLLNLLEPSEYIVSDQSHNESHYSHFALNFDLYAHFTSPVSRYPDLIVHRLLTSLVENDPIDEKSTKVNLLNICRKSNKNKRNGKIVQRKAEQIFMLLILREKPIKTKAFVTNIYQGKLLLFVKEFKTEKMVYINFNYFIMDYIDQNTVVIKDNPRTEKKKRYDRNMMRDNAILKSKTIKVRLFGLIRLERRLD